MSLGVNSKQRGETTDSLVSLLSLSAIIASDQILKTKASKESTNPNEADRPSKRFKGPFINDVS